MHVRECLHIERVMINSTKIITNRDISLLGNKLIEKKTKKKKNSNTQINIA